MSFSLVPAYLDVSQIHGFFNRNNSTTFGWRRKCCIIRCSSRKAEEGARRIEVNHYELLGVSVDSDSREIKDAYRKLQKKHHPDIRGQKGHEYTLMLNEAYKVLMREDLRRNYDISRGHLRMGIGRKNNNVMGFSSWKGPFRSQALFVDENACIGCRECVHHAGNTFTMDESVGCARVKVQFGDDDQNIQVSVDSCPVNCIHWVDKEELAVLEFLIQPKPKRGHGVFGQGWERPNNVFAAAKSLNKQLKQQHDENKTTAEEETPAQAEARANASRKIEMERISMIWSFLRKFLWFKDKHME